MLDEQAKKTMLLHIPHALYICGVRDGDEMNGFTASWVMQGSFKPPSWSIVSAPILVLTPCSKKPASFP